MPQVLIQFDKSTLDSIDRYAPPAKRKRAEFIRQAVKEAIRRLEFEQMRQAYVKDPDAATEADDWSTCEEWRP